MGMGEITASSIGEGFVAARSGPAFGRLSSLGFLLTYLRVSLSFVSYTTPTGDAGASFRVSSVEDGQRVKGLCSNGRVISHPMTRSVCLCLESHQASFWMRQAGSIDCRTMDHVTFGKIHGSYLSPAVLSIGFRETAAN
jgi:hypothetical protein